RPHGEDDLLGEETIDMRRRSLRILIPLRNLLPRQQQKPLSGPEQLIQRLRISEVLMIRNEQELVAVLLVPTRNGVRCRIAVGVDGVRVSITAIPIQLGRLRSIRNTEGDHCTGEEL